jgi:hypothetical protein
MNLNGAPMPPDMAAQFFPGSNMRPPSSNPAFTGSTRHTLAGIGWNRLPHLSSSEGRVRTRRSHIRSLVLTLPSLELKWGSRFQPMPASVCLVDNGSQGNPRVGALVARYQQSEVTPVGHDQR